MTTKIYTYITIVFLTAAGMASEAAIRYISVGGSDAANDCLNSASPCATISNGIAQASSGDTVNIAAGTYNEGSLTIDKNLTVAGENARTTIVQAHPTSAATSTQRVFTVSGSTIAEIKQLTIKNGKNNATGGGGIANFATLTVRNCSVVSNESSGTGGAGLLNQGTMEVYNSTIAKNLGFQGGGIRNFGGLTVENSTISNNDAQGFPAASGGGLFNQNGTSTLHFVTITLNRASNALPPTGGGIANVGGVVNLAHCAIANNLTVGGTSPDASGTLTLLGYNLIELTTGWTGVGDTVNLITGSDPQLLSMTDNGGQTDTHALLSAASPAHNAGDNAFTAPPFSDQRGTIPREENGRVDIGAFELTDGDSDNDNDALDDGWELNNGLDPNNSSGDNGGIGDPDNDGMSNAEEQVANTDPNDIDSFFSILSISNNSPSEIFFPTSTGRVYNLQYVQELVTGIWSNVPTQTNFLGTGSAESLVDTNNATRRNYRVEVSYP